MKIGLLTLHDSANYGAILQAYALRAYLSSCGHEVLVIDRRRNVDMSIRVPHVPSAEHRIFGVFPCDAHNGSRETAIRLMRTEMFLRERIGVTSYSFHDWNDAPSDLGVEVLVIGSDQVWNSNNHPPADYLPLHAAMRIPCIAYAASFGTPTVTEDHLEDFRRGFACLSSISVRESEAVELVRGFGFSAAKVVDPVLLGGLSVFATNGECSHKVVAYFLAEDYATAIEFGDFHRRSGMRIDYFADWLCFGPAKTYWRCWRNARLIRRCTGCGVDLRTDAGPEEFLQSVASAEAVVTNSYHALVLSLLLGKEVRVVLPTHPIRQKMNARILECAKMFVDGPLLHSSLQSALHSLMSREHCVVHTDEISRLVAFSREWLADALENCRLSAC